jgi:flagellar biosynthesis protein FliP
MLVLPSIAAAQTIPLVTSSPMPNGNTEYALGIQILMVMTVLTLLPAMLITMTAFTRILIVLAILRQALGTAQTPSNQIILGSVAVSDVIYHVACHRSCLGAGTKSLSRGAARIRGRAKHGAGTVKRVYVFADARI